MSLTEFRHLTEFRQAAAQFIAAAQADGQACPAYGAILSPAAHDPALAWQKHCFAHGWAGIHWPKEHGGQGLTTAHTAVWMEECARVSVAPYLNLQGIVLAGEALLRSGTAAQKQRFLRPTIAGEILWCQLFSEPGAGSDLAGLSATAKADGDSYCLNGQKVWSSNAQFADFGILLARTQPDVPKHKGISFFLLDMSLPGIEVRPIKQMTGDHEFCEVFFDDVPMPSDALLSSPGDGWGVAMAVLQDERGGAGASGVISLGKRLEQMQKRARSNQNGQAPTGLGPAGPSPTDPSPAGPSPTGLGPAGQQALLELFVAGTALSWLMQRNDHNPATAPISKLLKAELGYQEAVLDVNLQGAQALARSAPSTDPANTSPTSTSGPETPESAVAAAIERFLYAPGMRIAGGTNEIQKNIIGERILGLPREPSA